MNFHPSEGYRCFYVRDRRGDAVGLIMTHSADGVARMGWSLCKRNADVFRKRDARQVAHARMMPIPEVSVPATLRNTPMNRALLALAEDASVPHTVRTAARDEVEYRSEYPVEVPRQVAATPASEPATFLDRLRRFLFGF